MWTREYTNLLCRVMHYFLFCYCLVRQDLIQLNNKICCYLCVVKLLNPKQWNWRPAMKWSFPYGEGSKCEYLFRSGFRISSKDDDAATCLFWSYYLERHWEWHNLAFEWKMEFCWFVFDNFLLKLATFWWFDKKDEWKKLLEL